MMVIFTYTEGCRLKEFFADIQLFLRRLFRKSLTVWSRKQVQTACSGWTFSPISGAHLEERKSEVSSYSTNGSLICLDAYAGWLGNDSMLWADGADLIYGSMSSFNWGHIRKRYANGFNSGSTARKIADVWYL